MKHKEYEKLAVQAALKAGKVLRKHFSKTLSFDVKADAGIVTQADKESEKVIYDFFSKRTPDLGFLGEETGSTENKTLAGKDMGQGNKGRWIIDPLDGTTNFFHAFPHFNISIALELEGEIVVGVVYNPIADEMYHCSRGRGAFLNGKRMHVSMNDEMSRAMLGTGFAYQRGEVLEESIALFRKFTHATHGIRRPGAAALDLCYVARGIYDGFYEKTLNSWDVAAGYLLVMEAGGLVTTYSGKPFSVYSEDLVASNGLIHEKMIGIINSRD